jgi:hypothetical protein
MSIKEIECRKFVDHLTGNVDRSVAGIMETVPMFEFELSISDIW